MDDLIVELADRDVGDRVALAILQEGVERVIEVTLEERPTR